MGNMKKEIILIFLLLSILVIVGCDEEDPDTIYISGVGKSWNITNNNAVGFSLYVSGYNNYVFLTPGTDKVNTIYFSGLNNRVNMSSGTTYPAKVVSSGYGHLVIVY